MRSIVLIVLVSLLLVSCTPSEKACSADSDCVPATCCHPTDALNKAYAPDCGGTLCTDVC